MLLQRIKTCLSGSRISTVLHCLGVAQPIKRLYERRILRRGRHVIACSGQRIAFAVHDSVEFHRVENFHATEGELLHRLCECMRYGDVLFDVGANIGMVSVVASTIPGTSVHAFEPNPETARRARTNMATNGRANVTVHAVALGRENGTFRLYTDPVYTARDSLIATAGTIPIDVPVVRADDVGVRPTIAKIDVEGAEMDVLAGMEGTLPGVHDLFIEVHANVDEGALVRWLAERGFCSIWRAPRRTEAHHHFKRQQR